MSFSNSGIAQWLSGIRVINEQNESVKKKKIKISIEAERKTKIELKECVKETASKWNV